MNPESELSKAAGHFIAQELGGILQGCLLVLALALLFGWFIGSCVVVEDYSLRRIQLENSPVPPAITTTKIEAKND